MRVRKYTKLVSLILTALMVISILGACKKGEEGNTQASGSGTKTATDLKTTAKTTAKTTTQTTTQVATGTKAADSTSATSDSQIIISETGTSITDKTNSEFISDVFTEDTFYSVEGKIEEKTIDKPIDLGGRTVTFTSWSPTNMLANDPKAFAADNVIGYRRMEEAQKKYNFKLEYVTFTPNNATKFKEAIFSNTLAGIKMTDIFYTTAQDLFPTFVSQNIILPLDEYIDYENPLLKVNKMISEGSYFLGKHYGTGIKYYLIGTLMGYNRAIISREGLPDIIDLVEAKQWNWETFLDIAVKCTKDLDGDGIIDQYGLTTDTQSRLVYGILNSNGETGADFSTGKAIFSMDNAKSIKALQFVSDLVNVYKVYTTKSVTEYRKGTIALIIYTGAGSNTASLKAGVDSLLIPLPMGPDVSNYTNIGSAQFHAVSSLCEDPADVVKVWTEACIIWDENLDPIPELYKLQTEIYPYDWKWSAANANRYCTEEREYMLSIRQLFNLVAPDFTTGYPKWMPNDPFLANNIVTPLINGSKSISQIIESIRYELQDVFDQFN